VTPVIRSINTNKM